MRVFGILSFGQLRKAYTLPNLFIYAVYSTFQSFLVRSATRCRPNLCYLTTCYQLFPCAPNRTMVSYVVVKIAPTEAAFSPSARRSGCIVALLRGEVKRGGEYYELKIWGAVDKEIDRRQIAPKNFGRFLDTLKICRSFWMHQTSRSLKNCWNRIVFAERCWKIRGRVI